MAQILKQYKVRAYFFWEKNARMVTRNLTPTDQPNTQKKKYRSKKNLNKVATGNATMLSLQ